LGVQALSWEREVEAKNLVNQGIPIPFSISIKNSGYGSCPCVFKLIELRYGFGPMLF